jgi:fructosamine-3-kinase
MSGSEIRAALQDLLGSTVLSTPSIRVEGGCTHECFRFETTKGPVFVKVADVTSRNQFDAEVAGLAELQSADAIRVPTTVSVGAVGNHALLVLEWLDLSKSTAASDARLGEQLAKQHRVTRNQYGWRMNNYVGATTQPNVWSTDWLHFWRTHRYGAQLNLAVINGADGRFLERATLLNVLMDSFFTSYIPDASLLHGDLWSGNYAVDNQGTPVIFDPAVYYGDRECDLAMTLLFGGFSRNFYAAYESAWPLDDGWRARIELYNLYHVLNHYNLFGGQYLARAATMVEKLLAELGH